MLTIGAVYWLKRSKVFHQCVLRSLHEYQSAAKVTYCNEEETTICRQNELLTDEQYQELIKQKRKEAYARDLPLRRQQARERYSDVIAFWSKGLRNGKEMAEASQKDTSRSWAVKIATAKRWRFIDDKAPSKETGSPVSEGLGQRP